MPVEPPTTSTPADHLWPAGRARAAARGRRRSSTCSRVGAPTSMPMSTTRTRPARGRPGSNSRPGFSAAKQTVSSGAHRVAAHFARRAVDARRDVDRERRRRRLARACAATQRRVALERAAESGAEHRVDREVGARDARAASADFVDAVGERELVDADAARAQPPAPRPARRRRCCPCRTRPRPGGRTRRRACAARARATARSGPFDEHRLGCSRRDRAAIGLAHLRGGDDGVHAGFRLSRSRRGGRPAR